MEAGPRAVEVRLRSGPPIPPNRLLGRERELRELARLLRGPLPRVVTLTGPGGVGKTRLAVEAAQAAERWFAGGSLFVVLGAVADEALVVPTIARAVGLEGGDADVLERLARALAHERLLLVVDGFEHVLGAAPALAALLAGAEGLTLLLTSRAPLHLSGEQEYPVEPLALPVAGRPESARSLLRYPSIALFVERAQAVDPGFQLAQGNAEAVAAICARLDGVPLAIELAAARTKFLPPQQMLPRLERSALELLTGGPADVADRQRTLRSAIGWSYGLLGAPQQRTFERLAVFAGGAGLDEIEALGRAADREADVLGDVAALVDRSLLARHMGADGSVRLRMLETIREFALERLAGGGGAEAARSDHADVYLALADSVDAEALAGSDEGPLGRLEQDHDNLRAALRFLLDRGDAERALRLAGALGRFWLVHGYLGEGRRWLTEALAAAGEASPALRAKALAAAGTLAHYQAENELAVRLLEESRDAYAGLGDPAGMGSALTGLATVVGRMGRPEAARAMYEEALAIARRLGDRAEEVRLLERLGTIVWYAGEGEEARPLLAESLAGARALRLAREEANGLQALGWVELSAGDHAGATRRLEQARRRHEQLGDRWSTARALFGLGLAAASAGDAERAEARYGEALDLVVPLGDPFLTCGCIAGIAALAVADGRHARAALLLAAADVHHRGTRSSHSALVQGLYERTADDARATLGEEAFAAAWADGERLTLAEALEETRRGGARPAPAGGGEGLTAREAEVLRLLASGLSDAAIAAELVVSVRTVHAHVRSVYRKLGVVSRAAATRSALEQGYA